MVHHQPQTSNRESPAARTLSLRRAAGQSSRVRSCGLDGSACCLPDQPGSRLHSRLSRPQTTRLAQWRATARRGCRKVSSPDRCGRQGRSARGGPPRRQTTGERSLWKLRRWRGTPRRKERRSGHKRRSREHRTSRLRSGHGLAAEPMRRLLRSCLQRSQHLHPRATVVAWKQLSCGARACLPRRACGGPARGGPQQSVRSRRLRCLVLKTKQRRRRKRVLMTAAMSRHRTPEQTMTARCSSRVTLPSHRPIR